MRWWPARRLKGRMAVADRRGSGATACEYCETVGRGSERRPGQARPGAARPGPAAVSTHRRYLPGGGAGTDSQAPVARLGKDEA